MEVIEIQKFNIAERICGIYDFSSLIDKLENIVRVSPVKFRKSKILEKGSNSYLPLPDQYKVAIIDFEGSPIFMLGILTRDTIFTYYIEQYKN